MVVAKYFMISLHESMGPGRDRTRDPWFCSQKRIFSQTRNRLRYAARYKMLSLYFETIPTAVCVSRQYCTFCNENATIIAIQTKSKFARVDNCAFNVFKGRPPKQAVIFINFVPLQNVKDREKNILQSGRGVRILIYYFPTRSHNLYENCFHCAHA